MRKPKLYLAGPLFSEAERKFNHELKIVLSVYFDVYLSQEDDGLMVEMVQKGMSEKNASKKVFEMDVEAMKKCDVFLAILDGRTMDEGTVFEHGYVYSIGKVCVGLKTDPRQLGSLGKKFYNFLNLCQFLQCEVF